MEIRIAVQPDPDNPGATCITVDHTLPYRVAVVFRVTNGDTLIGEDVYEDVDALEAHGISYKSYIIEPDGEP